MSLRICCLLSGVVACVGTTAVAVTVSSTSLTATLDEGANGSVVRLTMPDGHDFVAQGNRSPLFTLRLTREDAYTNSVWASARAASACVAEPTADGVRLVYGPVGEAVERAVCTVCARPGDPKIRWRLAVTTKAGWKLEEAHFPQMTLAAGTHGDPEREAVVGGSAKGGVFRNPAAAPVGSVVFYACQPGALAAQFVSFYDDRRLFYFGSEDGTGEPKGLAVERSKSGLFFNGRHWGWSSEGRDCGFDFVTAALTGTECRPCDWRDAADFYRQWALRQRWCAAPLVRRTDLPGWIRDAPVMVRFYRRDFAEPSRVRDWLHGYWLKEFPEMPLVAAMWGWEPSGTWVSHYFPCLPSDAGFRSLVTELRQNGAHAFVWPSGYHWTKTYGQRADGSFAYDARVRFEREIASHAAVERTDKAHDDNPGWLKGGRLSSLCPGDPWTFAWWRDDVCRELARRGCEIVQADQICGGHFHDCWSRQHPHPPGNGRWKVETFRRQLGEMREAMRSSVSDAVVCYEEPDELFNDMIGIQDYRDCEALGEWAGVFNYLYHEFVPCFQSNVNVHDNRHQHAHMAVDGQIPFFGDPQPEDALADRLAMDNGDFETFSGRTGSFPSWEPQAGTHRCDTQVRHGGTSSLRFETSGSNEVRQIARNIAMNPENFRAGKTYRLSAWLKTARKGPRTNIALGLYTPGFKACRVHRGMVFPDPDEGWVRRTVEFAMPDEADLTLRFMINAGGGDTRVWIDDVRFEALASDGSAEDVRLSCRGWYHRFMTAWICLYRGEGRPWLAYGRQVRPPRIRCETTVYDMEDRYRKGRFVKSPRPSVHHAAYVSADGAKAVFFANGTATAQTFEYERPDGSWRQLKVCPDEILMERE